jgi:regulator of sirC expression with transglutaminase-like and TPR domain
MSEQQCRERIRRMAANRIKFNAQWFEPVTHKQLILRILNNLKHIYMHEEMYTKALAVCDRIVLLVPTAASERRDRGIVHLQLKHYARAIHDLKAYIALAPEAEDRDEMLEHIKTIRQTIAMMN